MSIFEELALRYKRAIITLWLLAVIAMSYVCIRAVASTVTLAWDASSTNVVYKVYWGSASRFYTNSVVVGTNLTCTVSNLVPLTAYWFAATAIGTNGIESDFSNEAKFMPPTNVVMFSVQLLGASSAAGPYSLRTNLPALSITNPSGMEFVRALVSVSVTNISK